MLGPGILQVAHPLMLQRAADVNEMREVLGYLFMGGVKEAEQ